MNEAARNEKRGERPQPLSDMKQIAHVVCNESAGFVNFNLPRLPGFPKLQTCSISIDRTSISDLVYYLENHHRCIVFSLDTHPDNTLKTSRCIRMCIDYQPVLLMLSGRLFKDKEYRLQDQVYQTLDEVEQVYKQLIKNGHCYKRQNRGRLYEALEFIFIRRSLIRHVLDRAKFLNKSMEIKEVEPYITRLVDLQDIVIRSSSENPLQSQYEIEALQCLGDGIATLKIATNQCPAASLKISGAHCNCINIQL